MDYEQATGFTLCHRTEAKSFWHGALESALSETPCSFCFEFVKQLRSRQGKCVLFERIAQCAVHVQTAHKSWRKWLILCTNPSFLFPFLGFILYSQETLHMIQTWPTKANKHHFLCTRNQWECKCMVCVLTNYIQDLQFNLFGSPTLEQFSGLCAICFS